MLTKLRLSSTYSCKIKSKVKWSEVVISFAAIMLISQCAFLFVEWQVSQNAS